MHSRVRTLALTVVVLAGARADAADTPRSKVIVLDNGLRVVLVEKRGVPLINISAAVDVDVGVEDEPAGGSGLVHLLEHCILFRGTERRSGAEVGQDVRRHGAYFNAHTGLDLASFDISLPADGIAFGLANQKEILFDLDVTTEELEKEKDIILEEIRMIEDDPFRRLSSLVAVNAFPGHPYGNPVVGRAEDIRAATPEALMAFHRTFFVPGNCALALVGDLPLEDMEAEVRKVFASVPKGPMPEAPPPPKARLLAKRLEIREEMDVKEAYLALGFVGPDYGHADRYATDLLVEILGRGINPMLNSALRARRDLVQTISMSFVPLRSGGIIMAVFTLDPKDVAVARIEAIGFLKRARELNFSMDDYYGQEKMFAYDYLRGAGNQIRFNSRRGGESGLALAVSIARHVLLRKTDGPGEDYLAGIGRVTSSDLRAAAAAYFSKGESVVVAIVPGKKN